MGELKFFEMTANFQKDPRGFQKDKAFLNITRFLPEYSVSCGFIQPLDDERSRNLINVTYYLEKLHADLFANGEIKYRRKISTMNKAIATKASHLLGLAQPALDFLRECLFSQGLPFVGSHFDNPSLDFVSVSVVFIEAESGCGRREFHFDDKPSTAPWGNYCRGPSLKVHCCISVFCQLDASNGLEYQHGSTTLILVVRLLNQVLIHTSEESIKWLLLSFELSVNSKVNSKVNLPFEQNLNLINPTLEYFAISMWRSCLTPRHVPRQVPCFQKLPPAKEGNTPIEASVNVIRIVISRYTSNSKHRGLANTSHHNRLVIDRPTVGAVLNSVSQ